MAVHIFTVSIVNVIKKSHCMLPVLLHSEGEA